MGAIAEYLEMKKLEAQQLAQQAQGFAINANDQINYALAPYVNPVVEKGDQALKSFGRDMVSGADQLWEGTKEMGNRAYGIYEAYKNAPSSQYGIPRNIDARAQEAQLFKEQEEERQRQQQAVSQ